MTTGAGDASDASRADSGALREARDGGVLTLTLARPDRGNALSAALVDALDAALARAFGDPSLHTVLLRGEGRHLCTGFDLADLDECSDGDLLLRFVRIESVLQRLWHAPLRTVAVGHGRCWGAGADLFAACECRIAVGDASWRFPGAGFGLVLGTRRLAERVGRDRALAWVDAGMSLDAATALGAGLATETIEPTALESRLARLGEGPAVDRDTGAALRAAAQALTDARDADLASLVRSAARPGLRDRIRAYRAGIRR